MARTAILGRLTWRVVTVVEIRDETAAARTLVLEVPDWPGHLAGQHVDVRLTAEDGYTAQRSYSVASAPAGSLVELTIQRVADGEVSSYLVDDAVAGDTFEIRGPVGGYFTWEPADSAPVLLVAGGSGIVPLMAMIRVRAATASRVPFRLVYSVRDPGSILYAAELVRRARDDLGLDVAYAYTREAMLDYMHALAESGILSVTAWNGAGMTDEGRRYTRDAWWYDLILLGTAVTGFALLWIVGRF